MQDTKAIGYILGKLYDAVKSFKTNAAIIFILVKDNCHMYAVASEIDL